MLDSIRKRRNSAIILAAFSAIILVFIFWGIGPQGGGDAESTAVAVVDGQAIPVKEYANLYKRELEYYRNAFKEQFNDEMAQKLNLKQKALDILINRAVALKEAKAQGIKVTEDEVQSAIKAIPVFSKDGAFDKDLYFKVLSSNRVSPAEFEKGVESDLLTAKVREKVLKDVKVTDQEIKDRYFRENRKVSLDFIAVDASKMKGPEASDEEAKAYLKKNASSFMVPARIKAFYAFSSYASAAKNAKISEAEIKEYFDKNQKRFETPGAVKARHILVRPDAKAADKSKANAEAKQKIEEVLKKAKSGAKFADLAKAYSQDPGSAKQGGDLGWFQKGIMIKQFEDTAFALKKGEISGVVETEFGYHVILVEDRKEPGAMPLKEAEPVIRKGLAEEKSRTLAREALAGLDKKLAEAKGADDVKKIAASEKGVNASVTDFFAENDPKSEIAKNAQLSAAAFSLSPGQPAKMVDAEDGVYLIKVLERKDAHSPDYAEIASDVKAALAEEKAAIAADAKAKELLAKIKSGTSIAESAKAEKLKVENTGLFGRAEGFMPKTGIFTGDKEKFFELAASAPLYPEVVSHNNRHYILSLAAAKEADEAGFEPRKESIKARLLEEKQNEVLNVWLKGLREKTKIKINEQLL